ncbi:riboflavin kinase [candidate division KSB1 bacterium]
MWIRRKVQKGTKTGQRIGYPTLNFHVGHFGEHYSEGVYSCDIQIADKVYKGALYYGPRLSHKGKVLEVHVQKFDKKIYGQFVQFRVLKKVRGTKKIHNLDELKKQIKEDLKSLN